MRMKPPKESPPNSWAEAVDRFLSRLEERRRSLKTIRCYREELLAYGVWSQRAFDEPPTLQAIMDSDLSAWITWLRKHEPRFAPATINKKRAAMKSFLRFSAVKGWSDPIEMPDPIKMQAGALRWLSRNQEHALLRAVNKGNVLRDRSLITFFLRLGVRIEEVSKVRLSDLKLSAQKGMANIHGKGDKDRPVPIDNDTAKLLHELVKTLDYPRGKDPYVFQGQRGALSPSAIHRIVKRYAKVASLDGISAHNLRHTCAKRWLNEGADPTVVATLLGHTNLNTTFRYLRPGEEDLRNAVDGRSGEDDDNEDEPEPSKPGRRRR